MDPDLYMKDMEKCLEFLKSTEAKWHSAGRLVDILRELASFGEIPLPDVSPRPKAQKRGRSFENSSLSPKAASSHATPDPEPYLRLIANLQNASTVPTLKRPSPTAPYIQGSPPQDWMTASAFDRIPSTQASTYSDLPVPISGYGSVLQNDQEQQVQGYPPISVGGAFLHSPKNPGSTGDFLASTLRLPQGPQQPVYSQFFPVNPDTMSRNEQASVWNNGAASLFGSDLHATGSQGGVVDTFTGEGVDQNQPLPTGEQVMYREGNVEPFFGGIESGMWQGVPGSEFDWEDWSTYLSNVNETMLNPGGEGGDFSTQ